MFHALNYRFLDLDGETDAWTIIFYVVHLLKVSGIYFVGFKQIMVSDKYFQGSILIITLTLIGSGWAFIKYVLADKEKKIFLLVVPLQGMWSTLVSPESTLSKVNNNVTNFNWNARFISKSNCKYCLYNPIRKRRRWRWLHKMAPNNDSSWFTLLCNYSLATLLEYQTSWTVVSNGWKSSAKSRKIGFISKLLYYVCSLHLFHTNSRLYSTYNTASTFDVGW